MPYLVIHKRGLFLMQVTLGSEPKTIGRRGADVTIDDPKLPRVQASFALDGRRCRVVDRSGEGTLVDGRRAPEALVEDGARITFGDCEVLFALEVPDALDDPSRVHTELDATPLFALPAELTVVAERVGDPASRREVKLGESLTIGSGAKAGLRLDSSLVSKEHATLRRHGALLMLKDPGSTNGTWYQGARLFELALPIGARFRVGPFELRVAGPPAKKIGRVQVFHGMRSGATVMHDVFRYVERIAPLGNAVAIQGESGTGKGLVAKAIHALSDRAGGPFVSLNCANVEGPLVESALFGHARGAFTGADATTQGAFQRAHGGTLFLDEAGELYGPVQAKLLKVLEEKVVWPVGAGDSVPADVRIITATHKYLPHEVAAGRFRADLFHRLYQLQIALPALRDRPGDLLMLLSFLLEGRRPGRAPELSPDALERLKAHRFPGNVRELENVVDRALTQCLERRTIEADDLRFYDEALPGALGPVVDVVDKSLRDIERDAIEAVMWHLKGNRSEAARRLKIHRSTLLQKLKEYGLERTGLPDGEAAA